MKKSMHLQHSANSRKNPGEKKGTEGLTNCAVLAASVRCSGTVRVCSGPPNARKAMQGAGSRFPPVSDVLRRAGPPPSVRDRAPQRGGPPHALHDLLALHAQRFARSRLLHQRPLGDDPPVILPGELVVH
jgi:hypothetical protein